MYKCISTVLIFLIGFSCFSQNWLTNFDEAKTNAQQNNQKIVLVFSGSDWCAPCIKLEKEIWETKEFKTFSESNFVMIRADFPRRKKNALTQEQQQHNNNLAERYNKNGYFPLVVVLDEKGNVLGETGYKKLSPDAFIKLLTSY